MINNKMNRIVIFDKGENIWKPEEMQNLQY